MTSTRHQTIKLARGRHRDPQTGVCAMELSSILAEERFTDHPQNVCPAVAAFLRGYNDALSAELRQRLFGIAATVVGSRHPDPAVRDDRATALVCWPVEVWRERRVKLPWPPAFAVDVAFGDLEEAGQYVGRVARRNPAVHERTVAFIEALIAQAVEPPAIEPPEAPAPPRPRAAV